MIKPVSISELTREIKTIIEEEFSYVYVTGEISNFKDHSSGHYYFTLKDDKAQINAIMWSSRNKDLIFKPESGMKVTAKGRITLYETRGSYQIDVFEMLPAGEGELQMAFERLKQKLFDEGLFSDIHKKELPEFPERVGVITSGTGAALQDFIRVTEKRFPVTKLMLFPANMQGAGSAESVIKAIKQANKNYPEIDILVITRGGGSIEDLWTFNDEVLARAIFDSEIPVVSAIGHEIDFTISDFVADLRAPTPSAAAEMIFPDKNELLRNLNDYGSELRNTVRDKIANLKKYLDSISGNYYIRRVTDIINEYNFRLDEINRKMDSEVSDSFRNMKNILDTSEKILNSLNPDMVLKRGFTIISIPEKDKIITRKKMLAKNEAVKIRFYDGEVDAVTK
ncbi:MAG: exodeoxyribonuclease VII large subunit [Ignavibacteriae bacterium]|nr:exodeoxyribonuclease VII large subunit [Ignavibacteriota bacterium]